MAEAEKLLLLRRQEESRGMVLRPLSSLWTPQGYLIVTRMANFLGLACDFPAALGIDPNQVTEARGADLKSRVDGLVMHLSCCDTW